jgi:hypothetical protein
MKNYFYVSAVFLIYIITIIISVFSDKSTLWEISYLLYGLQLIGLMLFLLDKNSFIYILNPISISLLYVLFSFMLGSWAFSNDLVYSASNLIKAKNWIYFKESTTLVLIFNFTLFILLVKLKHIEIVTLKDRYILIERAKILLFSTLCVTFPFLFIEIDLSIVGGSGGISIIPKSILCLVFIFYCAVNKFRFRYLLYLLILLLFAMFSSEDKRDAIFLIFPIILLEAIFNDFKITFKNLIWIGVLGLFLFSLIVLMSITRGYGSYETTSFVESLQYFFLYINSDFFLISFLNNIEVNYTYFHTLQAIEYIFTDSDLMTYGTTLIKFIFLLLPRSVFTFKPDSFIDTYTNVFDSAFREIGGSWPPNFYAELFWNFHYLSIVTLPLIYYLFHVTYINCIRNITSVIYSKSIVCVYFVYLFLSFIRGSGFDLLAFNLVVCLFFNLAIYSLILLFYRGRYEEVINYPR